MLVPIDHNKAAVGVISSLIDDPLSLLSNSSLPELRLRRSTDSYTQIFDVSANRELLFRGIGQIAGKRLLGHEMNLTDAFPVSVLLS